MMIEIRGTFMAMSLAGFPPRATRAEAEADEVRGLEVQAFIHVLLKLTRAQWDAVSESAGDVEVDAAVDAAWDAAWNVARGEGRHTAWDAMWDAARDATQEAIGEAAEGAAWCALLALLVRDLITADQFAVLIEPMRAAGVDFDKLQDSVKGQNDD